MRAGENEIAVARTLIFFVASRFGIEAFCAPHLVVDLLELFLAVWIGTTCGSGWCFSPYVVPGQRRTRRALSTTSRSRRAGDIYHRGHRGTQRKNRQVSKTLRRRNLLPVFLCDTQCPLGL